MFNYPGGFEPNHAITRIVVRHNDDFHCLQANGLNQRATLEPCLAKDPSNIQTFDWDTGKSWGLIRQAGDKSKALCLDIESENNYDKINFFNCANTDVAGRGQHQRFWFRKYQILTGENSNNNKDFNELTLID